MGRKRKAEQSSALFEQYVKKAKNLVQQKQYVMALTELNHAIRLKGNKNEVYLTRAKAHEMLGNYQEMMKAGKSLIKIDPESAQGYLIVANYFLLNQKVRKALEYCKKGLDNCNNQNEDYIKLKRMYEIYNDHEKLDPFKNLPSEILNLIFEQLSLKELMRSCLVNRSWREFLTNQHFLWRRLNINHYFSQLELSSMLLKRAGNQLQFLVIRRNDSELWKLMTKECIELKELKLFDFHWHPQLEQIKWQLKALYLASCPGINDVGLCNCLYHLENLEELQLEELDLNIENAFYLLEQKFEKNQREKWSLKTFEMRAEYLNSTFFNFFKKYCPDLESFECKEISEYQNFDFSGFSKLKYISIGNYDYDDLDRVPNPNDSLNLIKGLPKFLNDLKLWNLPLTFEMAKWLPESLLSLELLYTNVLDDVTLETITKKCPLLIKLDFGQCHNITNIKCLKNLVHLEILDINGCTQIPNEMFAYLGYLKNLKELNLCFTNIEDVDFLLDLPQLEHVYLNDCNKLKKDQLNAVRKAKPNCYIRP